LADQQLLTVINDFSSGEVDVDIKRGADSAMVAGGRVMSNWRVLNSRKKCNRPGRSALFLETGRVDDVLMSPGNKFFIAFGNGYLKVYNAAGTQVFASTKKGDGTTNIPWTTATVKKICWVPAAGSQLAIYICYGDGLPLNVPQVLTWDGVSQSSIWTLTTFAETIGAGGAKRTAFFRISPQSVTMQPSATTGAVNLVFSAAVLVSGMIGTRMRFCGRQILITAVTLANFSTPTAGPSAFGKALVIEPLPPGQDLTVTATVGQYNIGDEVKGAITGAAGIVTSTVGSQTIPMTAVSGTFAIGDHVVGATSGATGIITGFVGSGILPTIVVSLSTSTLFQAAEIINDSTSGASGTANSVTGGDLQVQLLQSSTGLAITFGAELVVGPSASALITGVSTLPPQPVSVWDDEVINNFRGWPKSVFYDQSRLGLCNFPSVPSGIAWGAIGLPLDFYLDATTGDSAIFDIAPGKSQVLFVLPGMESSEFIFCDNAIYGIPISITNPLTAGTISFNLLSEQGCAPDIKPQPAEQTILYVKAGGLTIGAVQAPGAYYRPYVIDDVSEFHSHLFIASPPIAIAVPTASTQFQGRSAYILLAHGTLMMGQYSMKSGLLDVGQEGKPKIGWLPWNGGGTVTWVSAQGPDVIFTTSYAPNGVPAVSVVEALDNTQYLDGALLVNALPEPFTPPGGKGPLYNFPGPNSSVFLFDLGLRYLGVYQVDGNGSIIPQNQGGENLASAQLVAGQPWNAVYEPFIQHPPAGEDRKQGTRRIKIVRTSISVQNSTGFVYSTTRKPAYFEGDDATQPAKQREDTYRIRVPGRAFDPRVSLTKDSPGPLTVNEYRLETSI
jgi:hypothetical protein